MGEKLDPKRCQGWVHNDLGVGFHQCLSKPKRDGYCNVHHPDAVAKRTAARVAKWDAENRAYSAAERKKQRIAAAERAVIQAANDFREWQGAAQEHNLIEAVDALREARRTDVGR